MVLLAVLIGGLFLAYWITSHENVSYAWDVTDENRSGKSNTHYLQDGKHRGISLMATERIYASDLEEVVKSNIEWIAVHPYALQPDGFDAPKINFDPSGVLGWGIRDSALVALAGHAKDKDLKVFLKPHLWLSGGEQNKWRSEIEMQNEAGWEQWFAEYSRFIMHYAMLADSLDIDMLSIGTELQKAALSREADWRRLIEDVREVYDGKLTYAANWYEEYEYIQFWDMLDAVGIQAYFPISRVKEPSVDTLIAGWQPHKAALEAFSRKTGKPILFTEIGYKSVASSTIEPWGWETLQTLVADRLSVKTQANAYTAFFEVFWDEPWFEGAYIWRWTRQGHRVDLKDRSFYIQNKPAHQIMARQFRKVVPPLDSTLTYTAKEEPNVY